MILWFYVIYVYILLLKLMSGFQGIFYQKKNASFISDHLQKSGKL